MITKGGESIRTRILLNAVPCKSAHGHKTKLTLPQQLLMTQENLCSLATLKCLSIGTPKTINCSFVLNGKESFLCVPIFKHIIMRLYFT